MKSIKGLFLIFYLSFAAGVHATEEIEFELDGLKIGDKLSKELESKYCLKNIEINRELECQKKININGVDLMARYFFYDSSLVTISLFYESRFYADLVKIYENKFSRRPHENTKEVIHLDENEKHTNEKVLWKTSSGNFTVEKYWNNLTKGYAYLESPEYLKYKETKKAR